MNLHRDIYACPFTVFFPVTFPRMFFSRNVRLLTLLHTSDTFWHIRHPVSHVARLWRHKNERVLCSSSVASEAEGTYYHDLLIFLGQYVIKLYTYTSACLFGAKRLTDACEGVDSVQTR